MSTYYCTPFLILVRAFKMVHASSIALLGIGVFLACLTGTVEAGCRHPSLSPDQIFRHAKNRVDARNPSALIERTVNKSTAPEKNTSKPETHSLDSDRVQTEKPVELNRLSCDISDRLKSTSSHSGSVGSISSHTLFFYPAPRVPSCCRSQPILLQQTVAIELPPPRVN